MGVQIPYTLILLTILYLQYKAMPQNDLRPTLPEATRSGSVWMVNGIEHNFVLSVKKNGDNSVGSSFEDCFIKPYTNTPTHKRSYYILATYNNRTLVGVFLPCVHTA